MKITVESGPIDGEFVLLEKRFLRRESLFILRGDGAALPGNFRSDALGEFAQRTIVEQERDFGLAEHVNEARCDDTAVGIDFAFRMSVVQISDGGEAIAANADIGCVPRISGAIDNVTFADDEIVLARTCCIQIGVIGSCRNFSEGLPSHLLRGIGIRRE